jgi:hypothetical protein
MTADSLPEVGKIDLETIKEAGYLDSQIVNPYTNTDDYKITIEEVEGSGAYTITVTPSIENPTGGTSSDGETPVNGDLVV